MKRYVLFPIVLLFLSFHLVFAQSVPYEVVSAAQSGVQALLNHIPPDAREDFGFSNNDNIENAVLGSPFNLFTITPEDLVKYEKNSPVASILTRTNLWYFPVMLDNKARTILVVDQVGGEWQAVSLGNTGLVKTLITINQRWPAPEGFNPRLIAVFQAKQYLLAVPEVDVNGLMSIPKSVAGEGVHINDGYRMVTEDSFDVIKRLIPIVTDNIRDN